jgi:hypothetical protein
MPGADVLADDWARWRKWARKGKMAKMGYWGKIVPGLRA